MKLNLMSLFLLSLFFSACSVFAPQHTPTATATRTPEPTNTLGLPTNDFHPPDAPLKEWHDIPIMPEAIAGANLATGYIFTVDVTREEVIAFYNLELGALGYINIPPSVDFTKTILGYYHIPNAEGTIKISGIMQDNGSLIVLIVDRL